ncbi:INO80 complex subunit E [Nasonia vitripennis]|uniref:INO80 complex subunit E N-terminal domain-containing protein n=1 Tax=Nasonia vitripennis TaxID=7425 RepID=A0A7M7GE28_NASVI|nr:INO80 complex subunit E [Nasonia vitripennis]
MANYKSQYCDLKRKLKFLIYENECFQEALRSTQRQLLKANRDKSFLLDRLLPYERVDASLSDSDEQTDSSEEEDMKVEFFKRRKSDVVLTGQSTNFMSVAVKSQQLHKKKKPIVKSMKTSDIASMDTDKILPSLISDGHMTPEEVERHLESRQNYLELVPEKAPPTVPTEMFSNDVSLDKLE